MSDDWQQGGFGLYVHWPFCQAKCPYCDFNSHVTAHIDQNIWAQAYVQELRRVGAQTGGRVLNSIFFGGGTPSLMQPKTVAAVIDEAQDIWTFANDIEITLEANPTSVEAARFQGYRSTGVNRISMGIQALNDDDLKRLGRLHSVAEAQAAFEIAHQCFERISFDLIYARQDQSLAQWEAELTQALNMAADHLSLYQLTIEDGTAFGARHKAGALRGLPGENTSADMFELTQDLCRAHGLPAYEVSNHARPGAESRHNMIYWTAGDYVGIGPGAHGRLTLERQRYATESTMAPGAWLANVKSGSGESTRIALSRAEQAEEYLIMGLRLRQPLYIDRYRTLAENELSPDALTSLTELGMLTFDNEQISITDQGFMVLNAVIENLSAD